MDGLDHLPLSGRAISISDATLPMFLGQPILVFSSLSGIDNLNELFEYDLELHTPDEHNTIYGPTADLDKEILEGTKVTIRIELDDSGVGLQSGTDTGTREITGIIARVRSLYLVGRHIAYHLTLRPWLWFATLRSDYKIYQEVSVVQILDALLGNYICPVGKRLDVRGYPKGVFQQQYGETDFAYFQRLTQEWGVSWFMIYSSERQHFVLTDSNSAFGPCSNTAYRMIR